MYFNFDNIKLTHECTPISKYDNKKEKHISIPKNKRVKSYKTIKSNESNLDMHEFLAFLCSLDRDLLYFPNNKLNESRNILTLEITVDY
tara:strand:+ start:1021 stop:1287 length:267 start_codon:yes stop_codon:yes gene_type:complete